MPASGGWPVMTFQTVWYRHPATRYQPGRSIPAARASTSVSVRLRRRAARRCASCCWIGSCPARMLSFYHRVPTLPDCLPLRPLALGRPDMRRAIEPERHDGAEVFAHKARQLGRGEEVDLEPGLGAVEVADGETAIAGFLGPLMPVPDVGPGGVDPEAEQAPGCYVRGGAGEVRVGLCAVAVLEDLDADDEVKLG